MELGNAYLAALRLPDLLAGRADALADELDESVSLAVRDGDGIRFVHQATRRRAMSLSFRIGDLLPAERTAPGALFAAQWTPEDWRRWRARRAEDPRNDAFTAVPPAERPLSDRDFARRAAEAGEQGWALDDQLIEPGLVAVAVPVRDPRTGRIACAASVVSHTSRHTAASLREDLLPRLREAVAAMEAELRTAPPTRPCALPAGLALWTGASKQELGPTGSTPAPSPTGTTPAPTATPTRPTPTPTEPTGRPKPSKSGHGYGDDYGDDYGDSHGSGHGHGKS
jgi:IclR family pca regulon transcriptional regulator